MSLWFVCSDDGVRASVVSTSGVYRWCRLVACIGGGSP